MQPLNPILSSAVLSQIEAERIDAATRAHVGPRRTPFAGLRRRAAARRGGSPTAVHGSPMPARAKHA
jgi:hypothetical protein